MDEPQFWKGLDNWFIWHTLTQLPSWKIAGSQKDVEIARAEELYRADFLETCRRIVKGNHPVGE